jgi:hypothetical protein
MNEPETVTYRTEKALNAMLPIYEMRWAECSALCYLGE